MIGFVAFGLLEIQAEATRIKLLESSRHTWKWITCETYVWRIQASGFSELTASFSVEHEFESQLLYCQALKQDPRVKNSLSMYSV